jgi:hypothetical protein
LGDRAPHPRRSRRPDPRPVPPRPRARPDQGAVARRRRGVAWTCGPRPTGAGLWRTPATDLDPATRRARLSYRRAAELFEQAIAGCVGGPWALHQLRHSALTHAAEAGANTSTLLAYSGHTSVASLARSARVSPEAPARWRQQRDPARHRLILAAILRPGPRSQATGRHGGLLDCASGMARPRPPCSTPCADAQAGMITTHRQVPRLLPARHSSGVRGVVQGWYPGAVRCPCWS